MIETIEFVVMKTNGQTARHEIKDRQIFGGAQHPQDAPTDTQTDQTVWPKRRVGNLCSAQGLTD